MKYYNVLAYFSLDYENCPFTKFSWSINLHIFCIYPIHINYMAIDRLGVLYAWMNGYPTLLHNIAPGKYIVIKVEYGLQLHFKIFLDKSDRKQQQQK